MASKDHLEDVKREVLVVGELIEILSGEQKYLQRKLERHIKTVVSLGVLLVLVWGTERVRCLCCACQNRVHSPAPAKSSLLSLPDFFSATALSLHLRSCPFLLLLPLIHTQLHNCRRATTAGRSGTRGSRCWCCCW